MRDLWESAFEMKRWLPAGRRSHHGLSLTITKGSFPAMESAKDLSMEAETAKHMTPAKHTHHPLMSLVLFVR